MTEIRTAIPDDVDKYLDSLVRTGPFASKAELVRAALTAFASSAGPLARDFDKDTILSPDGRVYQLEYAREASFHGTPGVGLVYDGGVILATPGLSRSRLVKSVSKLYRVSERVVFLASGLIADAHMAAYRIRQTKPKSPEELIDQLVGFYWEHTIDHSKRPLAAALLVGSVLGGQPQLFEFDPSGAYMEVNGAAVGDGHQTLVEFLEKKYRRGTLKDAERLALEALGRPETYDILRLPS